MWSNRPYGMDDLLCRCGLFVGYPRNIHSHAIKQGTQNAYGTRQENSMQIFGANSDFRF